MSVVAKRDVGVGGRGSELFIISIVFTAVAICFVAMRLATRLKLGKMLGLDDYAIMLSMCFSIAMAVANCLSVDHGYGRASKTLTVEDLREALKMFWVLQIFYKFTINLTKTSILLLYLRIFSAKSVCRWVYVALGYVLCYAVASIFATIFQCTPIPRIWNHGLEGDCINLTAFWYANAASNIFSDIVILTLPMPLIGGLQLPRRQKFGLIFVFALGSFVCVTSILRMTTLDTSSKSVDQTYGTMISTMWTIIEANTGIICACLPMLKVPLTLIFPRIFARTSSNDVENTLSGPTVTNSNRNTNATTTGNWAKSKQAPMHLSLMKGGRAQTTRESQERMVGTESKEVPMGMINKRTDVDVRFDENESVSSSTRVSSKEHVTMPPHGRAHGISRA